MRFLSPIIIGILILLLGFSVSKCSEQKKNAEIAQSNAQVLLADREQQVKNAEGQTVTTKQALQLQAAEFTKIKGAKDSTIRLLQAAVKAAGKKASAAVVFTAVTTDKAVGAVDSIRYEPRSTAVLPKDTAQSVEMAPVYYGYVKGPGFKGLVRADADSIALVNYTVTQKYTVAFADKQVLITPLGTNTQASDVQAFQLPPAKKPKRGLWAIGGGVVAAILTLLL